MMNQSDDKIAGLATFSGTDHYTDRFAELDPSHFRSTGSLRLSSIGMGTYLGDATDEVDAQYHESIIHAVLSGCNVIDTAINYRYQRSERVVGGAVRWLIDHGFTRDELVICTKGGYIPFDGAAPKDPYAWIEENLIRTGLVTPEDIHPDGHCMDPMFINAQIDRSLDNLGLEAIDVYYLHNPETQLSELNEPRFYEALTMAFRAMEIAVQDGRIGAYGIATWDAFLEQNGGRQPLQLEKIIDAARQAGGRQHHLAYVQLPVNLAMLDAIYLPNQKMSGQNFSFVEAAQAQGLTVVASASLLQGHLAQKMSPVLQQAIVGPTTDATRALQFARSAPGVATALTGMRSRDHVTENLTLASLPEMSANEINMLFGDR